MKRGVLRNGVVELLDPPPPEWREGKSLLVDEAPDGTISLEESFRKLEESVIQNDPQEIKRLQALLGDMRQQARELARRKAGPIFEPRIG